MRRTRLDELPQLWNVLKGDMSVIGPRPERPEFIAELEQEIPFYDVRHLVRPGLSGWAQVEYHYGNTKEDALIKLQPRKGAQRTRRGHRRVRLARMLFLGGKWGIIVVVIGVAEVIQARR